MNKYIIYSENAISQSGVSAEYQSIARNEEHVKELALQQGIDLDGYTIELVQENVKNELGNPYSPKFKTE